MTKIIVIATYVDKCQVLQTSLRNIFAFSYTLYMKLNIWELFIYLFYFLFFFIAIDSKLNFNKHIDSVCKKANSALAFLKRNLSSCKCEMKSDAYLMYVRPILEYTACLFLVHACSCMLVTKCNIDKLESVQRRAARFVNGDYRYMSSVTEMINTLRWNSLHSRRDTLRLGPYSVIISFSSSLSNYYDAGGRVSGADLGFIKGGGGLTQGTNLLGRGVQSTLSSMLRMLELGGSGGMPPQEIFEK